MTPAAHSKMAATRLLDLLAGWAAFVAEDEANQVRDALSAEEIGALYQAAGDESEAWERLSAQDAEEQVRAFVQQRVLPALLRNGGPLPEPPTAQIMDQHGRN